MHATYNFNPLVLLPNDIESALCFHVTLSVLIQLTQIVSNITANVVTSQIHKWYFSVLVCHICGILNL
jgi:hypothetical protein